MATLPPYMHHLLDVPEPKHGSMTDAEALAYATKLALAKKIEILQGEMPSLKDMRPEAQRHRALIVSVIESTINQKIKVDETQMRETASDQLPALLERIEKALKHD